MMQAKTIDAVEESWAFFSYLREEPTRPVEVVDVGARRDELKIDAVTRDGSREATVLGRVFFRREVAPAAPRLVADAPEPHLEGVATAHGTTRAHVRSGGGACRRVDVLDPLVELLRRQTSHICGQISLGPAQLAEAHE